MECWQIRRRAAKMKKARFLVSPQTGKEFCLLNMHEEGVVLRS